METAGAALPRRDRGAAGAARDSPRGQQRRDRAPVPVAVESRAPRRVSVRRGERRARGDSARAGRASSRARRRGPRDLHAGDTVGYDATWRREAPSRVATLAVGYADGYRRSLGNNAEALVHGRRVPVVGTVMMDMTIARRHRHRVRGRRHRDAVRRRRRRHPHRRGGRGARRRCRRTNCSPACASASRASRMTNDTRRAAIVVLDGVGIGAAADAAAYGDVGSNTLGNVARAVGGLSLPNFQRLGLGGVAPLEGMPLRRRPDRRVRADGAVVGRQRQHDRPLGDCRAQARACRFRRIRRVSRRA